MNTLDHIIEGANISDVEMMEWMLKRASIPYTKERTPVLKVTKIIIHAEEGNATFRFNGVESLVDLDVEEL
jgi:hypothetical protein